MVPRIPAGRKKKLKVAKPIKRTKVSTAKDTALTIKAKPKNATLARLAKQQKIRQYILKHLSLVKQLTLPDFVRCMIRDGYPGNFEELPFLICDELNYLIKKGKVSYKDYEHLRGYFIQ